jgi:arsenite methyltransferase
METAARTPLLPAAEIIETVQSRYSQCAADGAEGAGFENFEAVQSWGYDEEFLNSCGMLLSDESTALFYAACGGGCPLRLPGPAPAKGETVVDLGCGAGHDLVLASRMVGPSGAVLGVDLTAGMLDAARRNVDLYNDCFPEQQCAAAPVDLQCASLESSDCGRENYADVCISNGVFNLTKDKRAAFATAFRTLKPGGRFLLSDVCHVEKKVDEVESS